MLERAKSRKKKESGKEREQPSCSRRSVTEESHSMGESLCCFCLKKDELQHLVVAGTLHATENKAEPSHVQNITEKSKKRKAKRDLYRGKQREIYIEESKERSI